MFALSPLTARPGYPSREELAHAYAEASGRAVGALPWYQVLALWKAAIFLEGSFRRYRAGASSDPFFATLDAGVPALARTARNWIEKAGGPMNAR
jgi:aminoglycoside phosphotransferase (APT) family kinase protein